MSLDAAANPYAPPTGDIQFAHPPAQDAFPRALFGPRQILGCTLYSSLPMGILLMWWNYRAMGKKRPARLTLAIGLPVGALWVAVLLFMPARIAPQIVGLFTSLQFYGLCNPVQGPAVYRHFAAGGARFSHARVVSIVVIHMVVVGILAALVGAAIVQR